MTKAVIPQQKVILLVGLPCTGKSTWVSENYTVCDIVRYPYPIGRFNTTILMSSDDMIDDIARSYNVTYSEAFKTLQKNDQLKDIEQSLMGRFNSFLTIPKWIGKIIIDRTNLTKKSREKFILPAQKAGAQIFIKEFFPPENHEALLLKRAQEEGKYIPENVLETMKKSYQSPREDNIEGVQFL